MDNPPDAHEFVYRWPPADPNTPPEPDDECAECNLLYCTDVHF